MKRSRRPSRWPREGRPREHLHRQEHQAGGAGNHGPRRLVPHQADDRVRHERRGRRDARKGRPDVRGQGAGVQHRVRCRREDGRQHGRDLRAPDVRGRRDHGSGGCRLCAGGVHHRGRTGARHDEGLSLREGARRPAARPELPGAHHARRDQGGHHSRRHLRAGQRRCRQPVGHPDLRDRLPAHAGRPRPDHLRRHRRRPDQRHQLHRLPRCVREGPEHEGRGDDGRDWWHR